MIAVLMFISVVAVGDQRFETVGGFCHFVTPEGFQTANDDNEVFYANCLNSIRQNADGSGSGSTTINVEYPVGAAPFIDSYETTGADTGVDCVMVDSNGTTYVTQDWNSVYEVKTRGKSKLNVEINFELVCRNGAQQ
jgi:hypothetical protein